MHAALKRSRAERIFARFPGAASGLQWLKRIVQSRLLPKSHAWVQVQSGLARQMWMRIRLPGEALLWRGEHEPLVQQALLAVIRPGDVVYDIGAHVGFLSLGVVQLTGTTGRVIAFDGDPENIQRLEENRSRNQLEDRLRIVHFAVWSRTDPAGISFRRGTVAKSQGGVQADGNRPVLAKGDIIQVPAITLDDFVSRTGPPPCLIKIDVEGGEYEVLCGATNLVTTSQPLLIVEIHHQQAALKIATWLAERSYQSEWRIPKEGFPQCLFAWPPGYDGKTWMQNIPDIG